MEPTRIETLGDNGEWHEVHGITNIVIYEQPEAVRASLARIREIHEAMAAFMGAYAKAMRPALEEFARQLAAAASRSLRTAGVIDEQGDPVRRPDRPAWQSPYGPPPGRR